MRFLFIYEWRSLAGDHRNLALMVVFYLSAGLMLALIGTQVTVGAGDQHHVVRQISMIWLLLMFSHVLAYTSVFAREQTWLDQAVQEGYNLAQWILIRLVVRCFVMTIILVVITPLQCFWLHIDLNYIPKLMISLLAASPGMAGIMMLICALQPRGSIHLLVPVLIFPLWLPFIFLGFTSVFSDSFTSPLLVLSLLSLAVCCAAPPLAAHSLVSQRTLG